jgi:hypothetical protein
MEEEKVWLVSRNLEDDARVWFLQVQHAEGTPAWRRFTELLHLRFTSPPCPDLLHHVSPAANDTSRIFADIFTQLDRIKELLNAKDKKDRECRAAVRLQAAARRLLARRRAQALRATKASKEQATVRLQATVRGMLVRRMVRQIRVLLSSTLSYVFIHSDSPIRPAAPIAVEVQVWAFPVQRPRISIQHQASKAISFILVPAVVLDTFSIRASCFTLHPSAYMKPAEALFPWDPGGYPYILVFNKKGKPRCKRLNPISLQLSSSRTSWVSKGGGDVMGIKRGAVGRKCPSWALSPLVLISVSLSYLSIGIVPYCLGTRGVSPMYLLYSAHGAQWKASNEL